MYEPNVLILTVMRVRTALNPYQNQVARAVFRSIDGGF
jgi:hypothetical protein